MSFMYLISVNSNKFIFFRSKVYQDALNKSVHAYLDKETMVTRTSLPDL